jgi:hypothetical protein
MSFDYSTAEAWEASSGILGPGDYVGKIDKFPQDGTTSNGNPQIELTLVVDMQGSIRDWIVITPNTQGKVVQLFESAGIARPQAGEFDPQTGRLTQECLDRLGGATVGFIVRNEPDYKDATKMRSRVQGYVKPERITQDAPTDTRGLPAAPQVGDPAPGEPSIPF